MHIINFIVFILSRSKRKNVNKRHSKFRLSFHSHVFLLGERGRAQFLAVRLIIVFIILYANISLVA